MLIPTLLSEREREREESPNLDIDYKALGQAKEIAAKEDNIACASGATWSEVEDATCSATCSLLCSSQGVFADGTRTSTWYRGDPCDAIGEDLCYDHPTQLQHCDDGHEDQVEVDSKASVDSLICEDCAVEQEVECYDAEEEDYSVAKEPQSAAGYRGDPCIVSGGDTNAEDPCYDNLTQLDHSNDGYQEDFDYYDAEVEDSYYNDAEDHAVECYDADVEDCLYF